MLLLTETIYRVIECANKSQSTRKIADEINKSQVFNFSVSAKSVYDAMYREWSKENYVFYMTDEKVHPPKYNIDPKYYVRCGVCAKPVTSTGSATVF